MTPETGLVTLLHLLVFAYWLGGDIGVFYASTLVSDRNRQPAARLAAGKILADVDLAPRLCLLLALPTGLALAETTGWIDMGAIWIVIAFAAAFAWIALVVRLHLQHGATALRTVDFWLRGAFCAALIGTGAAALLSVIALPRFLALKLLLLGFAVAMGLLVRFALAPFGPAFARLADGQTSAAIDDAIARSLGRARPAVAAIWIALTLAAFIGVTKPA